MIWVVYSKSKIHGIYEDYDIALRVKRFLEEKGGYNNGVPKRFYYIDENQMNKLPKGMEN
jgi:hypothetical protein